MRTANQLLYYLVLLAIIWIIWQIVQRLRPWLWFSKAPEANKTKTPRPLTPKTGDDCPLCRVEKATPCNEPQSGPVLRPWREVRSVRGRKKTIFTQGYACNNRECVYYHIVDERVHALVGYGCHGKQENIQDVMCQACRKKFTVRRDTVLYRLKTNSEKVVQVLALLAEGVDVSTLERVMGIGEGTLRTWLTRAGMHAEKLHTTFFQELIFAHIQLDELWANVRHKMQDVWVWVAMEASTKVMPVMQVGPRTLDMAMGVIHELRQIMPSGCMPILSSDGLRLYYYALTAHMGHWAQLEEGSKPVWEIAAGFIYGQVKKIHRRRRLVKVEYHVLWGELEKLRAGLKAMGLTGKINTAFVERLNLTIRQGVSFLVRRTWGMAQFTPELELHLQWWRGYYHFVRYHESLRVKFAQPIPGKGKRSPSRYRSRTPAMAAGLATHRWTVKEFISYPAF
jgi:IS1 family transposase